MRTSMAEEVDSFMLIPVPGNYPQLWLHHPPSTTPLFATVPTAKIHREFLLVAGFIGRKWVHRPSFLCTCFLQSTLGTS